MKDRVDLAFALACGRSPKPTERNAAEEFLKAQQAEYSGKPNTDENVWTDFCQRPLAGNSFLYVE